MTIDEYKALYPQDSVYIQVDDSERLMTDEEYEAWTWGYYANPDSEDPDYDREQYIRSLREFEYRY